MNLLYCIPSLYNNGGMERILTDKVNYLINLPNYKITIVTTDQKGKDVFYLLDHRIKIVHLDIDFDSHFSDFFLRKYILHLRKIKVYKEQLTILIEDIGPDICISLCGKEIDFLSGLRVKCKKIAEIHFSMNFRKQFFTAWHKGVLWKLLGEIRTLQLKNATKRLDKLVVLTKSDQMNWNKTHNNIKQIYNFTSINSNETSNLKNKRAITVGRLDAQKGYDLLIEAWAYVAIKHPDWILDIFGSGPWEQILLDRINELNLHNIINIKGVSIDIYSNYIESSLFICSSRYEGFSLALLEASTFGLPLVSFNCEYGPNEIIEDGVNGFLVELYNIQNLADKICWIIENESDQFRMGASSFRKSFFFNKYYIMNEWIELFNQIVNKKVV